MRKTWAHITFVLVLLFIFGYFYYYNPNKEGGFFVVCTFKAISGYDCMGCGAQRAMHHLMHLEFLKALKRNALFTLAFPFFVYLFYLFWVGSLWGLGNTNASYRINNGKIGWVVLIVVILFTVLRNLPYFPFNWLGSGG